MELIPDMPLKGVDANLVKMLEELIGKTGASLLFLSPRGSRLYGLASETSDHDFFVITSKVSTKKSKYAKQKIDDDVDIVIMDIGTHMRYCALGVPENLEAMMSRKPVMDKIGPLRAQYRAGTQTWDRYLRTIKSFAMEGDFKHKRHSLRLALNLYSLSCTGRFNPTLTPAQAEFVTKVASVGSAAFAYDYALDIAWNGLLD